MVLMEILFAPPVRVLITNCIVTGAEPGPFTFFGVPGRRENSSYHSLVPLLPSSPLNDSHHQWDTGRAPQQQRQ